MLKISEMRDRVLFDSTEERRQFLDYLRKLAVTSRLVKEIILPIISEEEMLIPTWNLDFVRLCESLGVHRGDIPRLVEHFWEKMNWKESPDIREWERPKETTKESTAEAAAYLHLPIEALQAMARYNIIPAVKIKGKWYFSKGSLNAWLAMIGYLQSSQD